MPSNTRCDPLSIPRMAEPAPRPRHRRDQPGRHRFRAQVALKRQIGMVQAAQFLKHRDRPVVVAVHLVRADVDFPHSALIEMFNLAGDILWRPGPKPRLADLPHRVRAECAVERATATCNDRRGHHATPLATATEPPEVDQVPCGQRQRVEITHQRPERTHPDPADNILEGDAGDAPQVATGQHRLDDLDHRHIAFADATYVGCRSCQHPARVRRGMGTAADHHRLRRTTLDRLHQLPGNSRIGTRKRKRIECRPQLADPRQVLRSRLSGIEVMDHAIGKGPAQCRRQVQQPQVRECGGLRVVPHDRWIGQDDADGGTTPHVEPRVDRLDTSHRAACEAERRI